MGQTIEGILISRDIIIFFLQHFVQNYEKSILAPRESIKNSESVSKYSTQRLEDSSPINKTVMFSCLNNSDTVGSSDKFSISLATTYEPLTATKCQQATVFQNSDSKQEVHWWIRNLQIQNRKFIGGSVISKFKTGSSLVDP